MNAAAQDRYLAAQTAHQSALNAGKTRAEAQDAARAAADAKWREQVLAGIGAKP